MLSLGLPTLFHTSHIPSPALSSESHTVGCSCVNDRSDCWWADFLFFHFNSKFFTCCVPKNTSNGIEGKFYLAVRESPFPYPLNVKSVLASLFIMLLFLKMRNSPLRLQSTHLEHWSGGLRKRPALSLVGEVGSSSGHRLPRALYTARVLSRSNHKTEDCPFRFVGGRKTS